VKFVGSTYARPNQDIESPFWQRRPVRDIIVGDEMTGSTPLMVVVLYTASPLRKLNAINNLGTVMKIAVELSADEAELLSSTAVRLGVRPEELARATIADALGQDREEFRKAAEYVLDKNRDLYRRLG
jgi:antitoxin FitA